MLTDLETRSILRPIPQSENYCTAISRTAKQVKSLTNGGQENGSVCMPMPPRRWTDGPDNVNVLGDEHQAFRPGSCAKSSDKWKKDYDHNTCGSRPTFSSKLKENQDGMTGADVNPHKNIYASPVIYAQPRRPSWGFSDGQQRGEIWGDGVGSSKASI